MHRFEVNRSEVNGLNVQQLDVYQRRMDDRRVKGTERRASCLPKMESIGWSANAHESCFFSPGGSLYHASVRSCSTSILMCTAAETRNGVWFTSSSV